MARVPYLTKSRYLNGIACPKWLWLGWHEPLPYEDASPGSTKAVGADVGEKAQLLFPGGVLIDQPPWEHGKAVLRTQELMADPSVPAIFEAAFEYGDIRIRVDALERTWSDTWGLREVKASGGPKPEYVDDIAVQLYVLLRLGNDVSSTELIHINKSYIIGERGIDWHACFKRVEMRDVIAEALDDVEHRVGSQFDVLKSPQPPVIDVGKHCPSYCDYWERCTADKPGDWILGLPRLSQKQFEELTDLGVEAIRDVPDDYCLNATQEKVRRVWLDDEPYISADLTKAIRNFGPPAFYLDFETMAPTIPIYLGTKPFQQIPVQWSLHHVDDDDVLEHAEFLADGSTNPRREFAETLLSALDGSDEPIIVYSPFEKTTLNKLAAQFPDLADGLNRIIDRLGDLLPVMRGYTYFKDFEGSFSIKKVVPVLAPHLSYDDLDLVADGQAASAAFERIAGGILGPDEDASSLRAALLKYCKLDTMAMVEVHKALRNMEC